MNFTMPLSIHPLAEFTRLLAPPVRLAGLDIGTKTIGVALSTPDWQMATPLGTLSRTKWAADIAALEKMLGGYGVGGFIVGLPLNMDDTEGPQAQSVKQTIFNLIKADPKTLSGPVAFFDERLSTASARDLLADTPRHKAKGSGALDATAAQLILERALTDIRTL
jgi:putative Holliday junction resolvase